MSWQPCPDPVPGDAESCSQIEAVVVPRMRDVGDFKVHRVLPAARHGMVGPFIFVDQMGPARFAPGHDINVRPHPHINLATVTYLMRGEIMHRDSLGTEQLIVPGAVNWMSAGRGIVHSERSGPNVMAGGGDFLGLQTWVALPADQEESDPWFFHAGADELPVIEDGQAHVRLVVGTGWGETSPVKTPSDTFYADVTLPAGGALPVDADHEERALYGVAGQIRVDGHTFDPARLLVLRPGQPVTVHNPGPVDARFVIIGGATMDGPRHIWWNFVSSRQDRIEQAREDWKSGRFPIVPGDAKEFTPLPESQAGTPRLIPVRPASQRS